MSAKEERTNFVYGHRSKGTIKFGHLWMDSEGNLETAVQSGVMLQAYDARHYISMDINGARKGWTLNRCPGTYQILCGTDLKADGIGYLCISEMGDIVIRSPNGKIRMEAQDVEIIANGTGNNRGNIELDSNTSVKIDTPMFDVNAKSGIRMFTPFTFDLVANTNFRLVSNFISGLSCATRSTPDKSNPKSTLKYKTNQSY
jgi:hypothetical protein